MEEREHPSYGIIRISRSSIGGKGTALFGSSILHNNVIRISILKGVMEREANEDRFFPKEEMKDRLIEVEMSYTQFAEAITSLNIGQGVPVTITNLSGAFVEQCPYDDGQKAMREEMKKAVRDIVANLEEQSAEIEKLLNEKRVLSKEERGSIVSALKSAQWKLSKDIPYLQELFTEQMDKTVTEAKGEFESYLQNKMNCLAVAAMSKQMRNEEMQMSSRMLPELETDASCEVAEKPDEGMQMNM